MSEGVNVSNINDLRERRIFQISLLVFKIIDIFHCSFVYMRIFLTQNAIKTTYFKYIVKTLKLKMQLNLNTSE